MASQNCTTTLGIAPNLLPDQLLHRQQLCARQPSPWPGGMTWHVAFGLATRAAAGYYSEAAAPCTR